jgi:hypothetical protein
MYQMGGREECEEGAKDMLRIGRRERERPKKQQKSVKSNLRGEREEREEAEDRFPFQT